MRGELRVRKNAGNSPGMIRKKREMVALYLVGLLQTVLVVFIAKGLIEFIALFTNIFYYGRFSAEDVAPSATHLGFLAVGVPVLGGLIVGVLARYGAVGIRGHGIPEAMESILVKESRIPKRITILKPFASAIAIGSGGPFGAEGPIIATGGALGSLIGQVFPFSEMSRKILLASGAAAGMTAIFGTPMSAVLLSIELLLFEFKAGSFIPVAICAAFANVLREQWFGWNSAFFEMGEFLAPTTSHFLIYIAFGIFLGLISVVVIKSVYWVEDHFEDLHVHWILWPAIGGLVVGLIGLVEPRVLGVGYHNITEALNGSMPLQLAFSLLFFKFIAWAVALGSGTSGGTLAPIMTLGACIGIIVCVGLNFLFPVLAIDSRIFALVGMAGLFAGCSRAVLASVLFAFEATRQSMGLVPLLGTCSMAYIVSKALCADSIMTLKITRRGIHVPQDYVPPAVAKT